MSSETEEPKPTATKQDEHRRTLIPRDLKLEENRQIRQ